MNVPGRSASARRVAASVASSEARGECEGIRARRACVRWRSDDVARRGLARILGNFKPRTKAPRPQIIRDIYPLEAPLTDIDTCFAAFLRVTRRRRRGDCQEEVLR